jgi:protoporphyrinogen oxidase
MLWESVGRLATANGARIELCSRVKQIHHDRGLARAAVINTTKDASERLVPVSDLISSMPLAALIHVLHPPPPPAVIAAADGLRHRSLVVVALVLDRRLDIPDMWIYVPDPALRVGRIQHYPSWSEDMSPSGESTLGLEYFGWPYDPLFRADDDEIIALAGEELTALPFAGLAQIRAAHVFRAEHAYPVYDAARPGILADIRRWLEHAAANVQPIGRNGLHRYDNQDHAAMTGLLAAENVFGASHDLWSLNAKPDYHEDGKVVAAWS